MPAAVPAGLPAALRAHLWAFPPACHACGRLLPPPGPVAPRGYPYLCGACRDALPWCEDGSPAAPPPSVERLWACCRYAEPVRGWVQRLKYGRNDGLVRLLARLLHEAPFGAAPLRDAPWVVPVPLHPWRLWQRGFNQSLLLAHAWLRAAAAPGTADSQPPARLESRLLVRHRYTRPQVRVTGAQRRENVAGAFSLHRRLGPGPAPLEGRAVLLLDDVTTTGATLSACAQALRAAGAARVEAVVIAAAV